MTIRILPPQPYAVTVHRTQPNGSLATDNLKNVVCEHVSGGVVTFTFNDDTYVRYVLGALAFWTTSAYSEGGTA